MRHPTHSPLAAAGMMPFVAHLGDRAHGVCVFTVKAGLVRANCEFWNPFNQLLDQMLSWSVTNIGGSHTSPAQ